MPFPSPTRRLTLAGALACFATVAFAQSPPIKPGLWEVQSEAAADGRKDTSQEERMKSLPPAVRAQLEASMKQKGIALGAGGLSKICFTQESMDPARWSNTAGCKTDYGSRSGTSWKWHSVCTQPAMTIDGEALFASPERYTVNTTTTLAMRGESKTSQRTVRARWLGADCGDLKPFDPKR